MWTEIDWMTHMDKEILDFFAANREIEMPTRMIAKNIERHRTGVSRHLGKLAAAGLVNKIEDGWYVSSPLGVRFSKGEVRPEEKRRLNEMEFD